MTHVKGTVRGVATLWAGFLQWIPQTDFPERGVASTVASVIDSVVNLAKRRGLVYPCGEIYGGTKSAWDYGPLGVELKENIKRQW